eukprot:12937032-Prorocentrum_lima.AAC.1
MQISGARGRGRRQLGPAAAELKEESFENKLIPTSESVSQSVSQLVNESISHCELDQKINA